jgi:hypothetical protein
MTSKPWDTVVARWKAKTPKLWKRVYIAASSVAGSALAYIATAKAIDMGYPDWVGIVAAAATAVAVWGKTRVQNLEEVQHILQGGGQQRDPGSP